MELAVGTVQFGLVFGKKPNQPNQNQSVWETSNWIQTKYSNQTESVSFEGFVLFGLKGRIKNK